MHKATYVVFSVVDRRGIAKTRVAAAIMAALAVMNLILVF